MSTTTKICQLCGALENLSLCLGCKNTWYCSHEHQRTDWKIHKQMCKGKKGSKATEKQTHTSSISSGHVSSLSSSSDISSSNHKKSNEDIVSLDKQRIKRQTAKTNRSKKDNYKTDYTTPKTDVSSTCRPNVNIISVDEKSGSAGHDNSETLSKLCEEIKKETFIPNNSVGDESKVMKSVSKKKSYKQNDQDMNNDSQVSENTNIELNHGLIEYVIDCMEKYGICMVDNFLGEERGISILNEVETFYNAGIFSKGLLVNSKIERTKDTHVRGDLIMWVDGNETGCENIKMLMERLDSLVLGCKGRLGRYNINGRTKGMVACYPGNDSGYIRHVDNPNGDGRCITCIYYINKDWDVKRDGGLLRIFPEDQENVANINPKFDRLLFFWSDRRNPHEVQPTRRSRYAITVWYYDAEEKASADKFTQDAKKKSW